MRTSTSASLYFLVLTHTVVLLNATLLPNTEALNNRRSGHYGVATWYTQNGNAGACGSVHSDYDWVVALETAEYAGGANCWRNISITDTSTGASYTGLVADECPTCGANNNIDLSKGLFQQFASLDVGQVNVKWDFV